MKILVPALGTRLRLAAPWTFTLHRESRNESLFPLVGWGRENAYNRGGSPSHRSVEGNRPQYQHSRSLQIMTRAFDFGEAVAPGTERATYKVLAPGHARVKVAVSVPGRSDWTCAACGTPNHYCPEIEHEVACEVNGYSVVVTGHVPPEAVYLGASAVLKGGQSASVTLPEGTVLTVDRYYIRSGANDFDSITFRLPKPTGRRKKGDPVPPSGRFWVKLRDANTIEFESLREDQPWWFQVADRLRAGETLQVEHDVPKVPKVLTVEPLTLRTVADLPSERWLVYQEGQRVAFWLVDADPSTQTRLQAVHGEAFGTGSQLRSSFLPVEKVVGKVAGIA